MHLIELAARWAWETSLEACVLMAPALLIQMILRRAVFTPMRHLLGLLVVARLLMPFAPESSFSALNLTSSHKEPLTKGDFAAPVSITEERLDVASQIGVIAKKSGSGDFRRAPNFLALVWLSGVLAMLVRVFWQHRRVRVWIRGATLIDSGIVAMALDEARELSGTRRRILVYESKEISTPAVFGIVRPAILLPAGLVESVPPQRLRLILLHEVAHVLRWDVLINWLMIFARALHWFNPMVWLAMRRLRAEQELLCDGDVMRRAQPEERQSYGETLLALASQSAGRITTLIPFSSGFKQMKERIAMIKQFKPMTHRLLVFAAPPLAVVIALITFTGATTKKLPVAPPAAVSKNTPDKNLDALRKELEVQTVLIRRIEAQIDEGRRELGIVGLDSPMEAFKADREAIQNMEREKIRADAEAINYSTLLNSLKAKSREELRHAMPTAYHDEALDRYLADLAKAEQQMTAMRKDYADEHPEIVRLAHLIKNIDAQIESRMDGVIAGLATLLSARQAVADDLAKNLDNARVRSSERRRKAYPLLEIERDLEGRKKLRDSIFQRFIEEEAEERISKR